MVAQPNTAVKLKKLTINLPEPVFEELQDLSKRSHQPMGILLRNAFALAQLYFEEKAEGNTMAIVNKSRVVIKEIVLPS